MTPSIASPAGNQSDLPFGTSVGLNLATPGRSTCSPDVLLTGEVRVDHDAANGPLPPAAVPPTMDNLRAVVQTMSKAARKNNSRLAYDPKEKEYMDFCDHCFGALPPSYRYTLDFERAYRFLFYQAFRSKRSLKGLKKGNAIGFLSSEYDSILHSYSQYISAGQAAPNGQLNIPIPENGLGAQQVNTYRTVLWRIHCQQLENRANNQSWESIYTLSCQNLLKLVSGRKMLVKKLTHAEKLDSEDTPFSSFTQVHDIQGQLLLQGVNSNARSTFTSLRNRFSFLSNFASILRNESMHIADLSDVRCFKVKRAEDHDPMLVKIMKIATGKTVDNDGPSQYGRATRHKNVFECPIGAEAMYLFFRFDQTREWYMDPDDLSNWKMPDMRDNSAWFDIKVLIEHGSRDNTKSLSQRCYTEALKEVFKLLKILADHWAHWGRVNAPSLCEFKELSPEQIKEMGKL